MKTILNLIFLLSAVPFLAQAIPDYTLSAFGLSKDVVKLEKKTYNYYPSTNSYSVETEKTYIFENGLLKNEITKYGGVFWSNTTINYTYNANGKVIKEDKNAAYSSSSSQTTTSYLYEGNKLVTKTEVDLYETLTSVYTYDSKGKISKVETKKNDGKLYSVVEFANGKDEKNYTKNTNYYITSNGNVSNENTEVFVNGRNISFVSDSKEYGKSTYEYTYDAYGNILKRTEDDIIVEDNKYTYDTKGNWYKCLSYQESWLGEISDVYEFRKITYKSGSVGSTDLDQKFINENPSSINKPISSESTTTIPLSANITNKSASNPGCEGNCQDGYGTYYYSDGGKHEGFYSNGNRNGTGIYTFASGDVYYGNFVNGAKDGYAFYKWTDGSAYIGYYKNEKIHGEGMYVNNKELKGAIFKEGNFDVTYNFQDNGVTTGCVAGDCNNGFGKYIYSNGDLFIGFFTNGYLKHGMYSYSNKDFFIGEYVNSQRQGLGYYYWDNTKNSYLGMYQNDTYHGLGHYYVHSDATKSLIGEFRNGSLYKTMK